MKALLIGGTGTISTEISKRLVKLGWELTLLNRGNTGAFVPEGARVIKVDVNDEEAVNSLLGDECFDVIAVAPYRTMIRSNDLNIQIQRGQGIEQVDDFCRLQQQNCYARLTFTGLP